MRIAVQASHGFEAPGPSDFWQPLVGSDAFAITRPMVLMALSTLLIGAVMVLGTRRLSLVPGRGQWALEGVYGLVRGTIARDIIGERHMKPFLGLLFALFTVILVNNLGGTFPVVQYPTMSRIAFPIVLALVVWGVYLGAHIRRRGLVGFLKHLVPPGLPVVTVPLVFLLELLTYLVTRPLTLSLRLFGSMFAGHILLLLFALGGEYMLLEGGLGLKLVSLPTFVLLFAITAFEILIAFLQAYVFILLTAVYIAEVYADDH